MAIIWLMMVNHNLVGAWPTPLKNDGVKVSWDYEIPNIIYGKYWKVKKNVPNHQPAIQWDFTTQLTITNPIHSLVKKVNPNDSSG